MEGEFEPDGFALRGHCGLADDERCFPATAFIYILHAFESGI
jgi:hypothetical protein